jgi:hypothetical protein
MHRFRLTMQRRLKASIDFPCLYDVAEYFCGHFWGSSSIWVGEVNVVEAKLFSESRFPLEGVHQRPSDVSFHVAAVFDGTKNRCEV